MVILVDTGILLRLVEPTDPLHVPVRQAVRLLRKRGDRLVTSPQNAAEFWNVCTRPASSRGGFGLTIPVAERRLRIVERLFPILADSPAAYARWRQLIVTNNVMGVQVHDARLVALMEVHGISHLLSLNTVDFSRYSGINALDPSTVLATVP